MCYLEVPGSNPGWGRNGQSTCTGACGRKIVLDTKLSHHTDQSERHKALEHTFHIRL